MPDGTADLPAVFYIGSCKVDSSALKIHGPGGEFTVEPKIMDVLLMLVRHHGDVVLRRDLINEVWQTEFGGDESLTRSISLLRKILGDTHGQRNTIVTVPRRGYRLIVPPTQVRAGDGVEPTPVSLKRRKRARLPVFAALATAGLATLVALVWQPWSTPARGAPVLALTPVAVHAFDVTGEDSALEGAAQALPGMVRQELLNNGVAAVIRFPEAGQQPAVKLIGTISPRDGGARTNIQLVDMESGHVMWATGIDVSAEHVTNLTDIVANRTAHVTACAQDLAELIPAHSPEDMSSYFRLCALSSTKYHDDFITMLRTVADTSPGNPNARALYAVSLAMTSAESVTPSFQEREEITGEARQIAEDILRDDPGNAFANLTMAWLSETPPDWLAIERYLTAGGIDNAIPTDLCVHHAFTLRRMGRNREAIDFYRSLLSSQPARTTARTRAGWLQASLGNYREANRQFDYIERTAPDWPEYAGRKNQIAWFYDDPASALEAMDRDEESGPPDTFLTCMRRFLEAKLQGHSDIAPVAEACTEVQVDYQVRIFTQLGDLDRAFAEAEKIIGGSNTGSEIVLFYPDMAPFRSDPRFWGLTERIGLNEYWLVSGNWPDFCSDRDLREPCEVSAQRASAQLSSSNEG